MRTTESRKPISVPATKATIFDKMKATVLQMTYLEGKTRLQCRFEATDGETILPGHPFSIDIDDLEAQENLYPKLRKVMDDLASVLGLYYKHRHLAKEIDELDEDDIVGRGLLSVIRDAVESDLRQAITIS